MSKPDQDPITGDPLETGCKPVKPADLFPSQATADRAYQKRGQEDSTSHASEKWQDQGKRLDKKET